MTITKRMKVTPAHNRAVRLSRSDYKVGDVLTPVADYRYQWSWGDGYTFEGGIQWEIVEITPNNIAWLKPFGSSLPDEWAIPVEALPNLDGGVGRSRQTIAPIYQVGDVLTSKRVTARLRRHGKSVVRNLPTVPELKELDYNSTHMYLYFESEQVRWIASAGHSDLPYRLQKIIISPDDPNQRFQIQSTSIYKAEDLIAEMAKLSNDWKRIPTSALLVYDPYLGLVDEYRSAPRQRKSAIVAGRRMGKTQLTYASVKRSYSYDDLKAGDTLIDSDVYTSAIMVVDDVAPDQVHVNSVYWSRWLMREEVEPDLLNGNLGVFPDVNSDTFIGNFTPSPQNIYDKNWLLKKMGYRDSLNSDDQRSRVKPLILKRIKRNYPPKRETPLEYLGSLEDYYGYHVGLLNYGYGDLQIGDRLILNGTPYEIEYLTPDGLTLDGTFHTKNEILAGLTGGLISGVIPVGTTETVSIAPRSKRSTQRRQSTRLLARNLLKGTIRHAKKKTR